MYLSTGRFETRNASRYLLQLASHFAHKVDLKVENDRGFGVFETGEMEILAQEDALIVHARSATAKGMIQLRFVLDKHLVTFAFRDAFTGMAWDISGEPGDETRIDAPQPEGEKTDGEKTDGAHAH